MVSPPPGTGITPAQPVVKRHSNENTKNLNVLVMVALLKKIHLYRLSINEEY